MCPSWALPPPQKAGPATPPPLAYCQVLAAPRQGLLPEASVFCQFRGPMPAGQPEGLLVPSSWHVNHRPHGCGVTAVSNLWGPCRAGPNPCLPPALRPPCSHPCDGADVGVSGRGVFSQKPGLRGCGQSRRGLMLGSISCLSPQNLRSPQAPADNGSGVWPPTHLNVYRGSRWVRTGKVMKMGSHKALVQAPPVLPGPRWVLAPSSDKNGTGWGPRG